MGVMITKPWQPNRRKIGDLLEALGSITILPDDTDQPSWLDHRKSGTIIAVGNGLLDLVSRDLYPHTPRFFNQTSVPFAYEPHAAEAATVAGLSQRAVAAGRGRDQPSGRMVWLRHLWPD